MTAGKTDPVAPVAILFDTETTGAGDGAQIIEAAIGFVAMDEPIVQPTLLDLKVERFNPSVPIELGALATHHIIPEYLTACRPSSMFALPEGVNILIGHNVDFDWTVAGKPKTRRIDTCALARSLWPTLDSFSLGAVIYSLYPEDPKFARGLLENAHSAEADVYNLHRVFCRIVELLQPPTWAALWRMSEEARIPVYMPFGKHRPSKSGEAIPIVDLPVDYRAWVLKQPDMDPYVRIAVRRSFGFPDQETT